MSIDAPPEPRPVAVALKYSGSGAPKVTAKGRGLSAEKILDIAAENDVPLWQDAALVSVLAKVDLGDQIPESLYRAVAEVIAFAWQLRDDLGQSQSDTAIATEKAVAKQP